MFHPVGHPMERGWVGRIDGDRVVHLAAQTLQSFFTGGGSAREHAAYSLAEVVLLAPVLHPPAVRIFDDRTSFVFANPAAIVGPRATVRMPSRPSEPGSSSTSVGTRDSLLQGALVVLPRIAAVVGGDETIAGFTVFAEWRDPWRAAPKDRDFALGLGPLVVTRESVPDRLECVVRAGGCEALAGRFEQFEWEAARAFAAENTRLVAGDLLASPALGSVEVSAEGEVAIEVEGVGTLEQRVAG